MDPSRDKSDEARARAEARFQKTQLAAQQSETRVTESKAAAKALDVKTAGLMSQRLARDAAEAEVAKDQALKKPPPSKRR